MPFCCSLCHFHDLVFFYLNTCHYLLLLLHSSSQAFFLLAVLLFFLSFLAHALFFGLWFFCFGFFFNFFLISPLSCAFPLLFSLHLFYLPLLYYLFTTGTDFILENLLRFMPGQLLIIHRPQVMTKTSSFDSFYRTNTSKIWHFPSWKQ